MKITKLIATATVAALAAGAVAATAGAYNAGLVFQNTIYSFRNDMAEATYGAPYWNDGVVIAWPQGGADDQTYPDYADYFDWDIEAYILDGGFNDITFDGDGTYTVSCDGFDWAMDGVSDFNMIQVSTDVPFDAFDPEGTPTAFVTSATIYVDGVATATIDNPAVQADANGNLIINGVNIYNSDTPSYTGAYPTEKLAVEFTVTGLGGGSADSSTDSSTDAVVDTNAPVETGKDAVDTGVEGVAAVAGIAAVAGGALLLSKKRK